MGYPAFKYISPEEYLSIEIRAHLKHEYFEGRIYDMAGASFDHNFIVSNITGKLNIFLDGKGCNVFGSDLRITSPGFDSFMYPDITILCDEIKSKENGFDTATNPTAIIEVMSPSTRGYDMAFKFHYYKQIPSLQEYILVDSTRHFVQINRRKNESSWEGPVNIEDENLSFIINTIGLEIPLKGVYRNVSFTEK
jgi:Uma2 family endonuclease